MRLYWTYPALCRKGRRLARPVELLVAFVFCLALLSHPACALPPETMLHSFNAYAYGAAPNWVFPGRDGNYYGTTAWGGSYGYGTVFKYTPSTGAVTTLHTFNVTDGSGPNVGLIQASDGFLYGMTYSSAPLGSSGPTGPSLLYKLSTDGSTYEILRTFDVPGYGGVTQGTVGAAVTLFGTTSGGSAYGYGTVFTIAGDGSLYSVLHDFGSVSGDGAYPASAPIQESRPRTSLSFSMGPLEAEQFGSGTVYKISTIGTTYSILHSFNGADGNGPYTAPLIQGPDQRLYGTTPQGGASNDGVVFQISTDGSTFNLIHCFSGSDGATPYAGLAQSGNGVYFGATFYGGADNDGTTFQFSSASDFQSLHQFNSKTEGAGPECVVQGSDNALHAAVWWGASNNAGALITTNWGSSSISTVGVFGNDFPDGANPEFGRPAFDRAGNCYGVTQSGGDTGQGALYRLSPSGEYTILHSFAAGLEGADPDSGAIVDSQGNLYGATYDGGLANVGTIWSYTPATDTFTTLYTFGVSDSLKLPAGGLILDGSSLIGASTSGGAHGCGAIYQLILPTASKPARLAILHSFSGGDGSFPFGRLLLGADRNLYGTTEFGGVGYSSGQTGYGTLFKLTPKKQLITLRQFEQGDGFNPVAGLTQGEDGALYGTLPQGSINNLGSVYQINTDGSGFNVLHAFGGADGSTPICDLIQGSDGLLYGTTRSVTGGFGTVFQISTDGHVFNTLHTFAGQNADGADPWTGVTEGPDGNLYGATYLGGSGFCADSSTGGCLYQLAIQLPLIASFTPGSGPVGRAVSVKGVNLAGASVTIGGVTQTVLSNTATLLKFQVAAGTTTGPIVITTSNGTVTSNSVFKVIP